MEVKSFVCPNCGGHIKELESSYCKYCGTKLEFNFMNGAISDTKEANIKTIVKDEIEAYLEKNTDLKKKEKSEFEKDDKTDVGTDTGKDKDVNYKYRTETDFEKNKNKQKDKKSVRKEQEEEPLGFIRGLLLYLILIIPAVILYKVMLFSTDDAVLYSAGYAILLLVTGFIWLTYEIFST